MGSTASKAARRTPRKYPAVPSSATVSRAAPKTKPAPQAVNDGSKNDAIRADGMDPDAMTGDFSQRLQQMGVVQPNPTYSPSSTAGSQQIPNSFHGQAPGSPLTFGPSKGNPTLSALEARRQLQHRAEAEFEALGTGGRRRFVDMRTLIDAIRLLDRGIAKGEVETRLKLEDGLLDKLGGPNILSHESTAS